MVVKRALLRVDLKDASWVLLKADESVVMSVAVMAVLKDCWSVAEMVALIYFFKKRKQTLILRSYDDSKFFNIKPVG